MVKSKMNRRKFLGTASCATVGYTTLFSSLVNLKSMNAAAVMNSSTVLNGDYKAIICLALGGGMDSYNMVIPRGNAEYNEYATTRSNQAIPQADLLPIIPNTSDGKTYGLHPALTNVQSMFAAGDAAVVANVGSLIEPITKPQFYAGSIPTPLGLYSHADQFMHWQTSVPQDRVAVGWGGKIADLLNAANTNQTISMNMSLSGSNVFQTGNSTVEYSVDPYNGSIGINGYGQPWQYSQLRTAAIDSMIESNYQDAFKQAYVDVIKTARDGHVQFSNALESLNSFDTQFTDNYISQAFHMVAKTIAARDTLGMGRQIFYIEYGGWDHHDEVLTNMQDMFSEVDTALGEFYTALDEIDMKDCATTFTMSEFARTLTSNGNGTDHAWGGNSLVLGGSVNGSEMYGSYPSLALDNPLEVGGGVLIPTTSVDQYIAELSRWYGVMNSDLPIIMPNIGNFYDINSQVGPLGFMNV